jgi:hypothetical protein
MSDRKDQSLRQPKAGRTPATVVRLADYRLVESGTPPETDNLGAIRAGLFYIAGDLRRIAAVAPEDMALRIHAVSQLVASLAAR